MFKRCVLISLAVGMAGIAQASSDPLSDGIATLQRGDPAHALPLLRRAVGEKPSSASAHNFYGFALGRTGAVEEAIRQFREALKIDPRYPDALYNLGTALIIEGEFVAARQNL
ncbi:MAG: tetratricopeptide repeat protein, partial [Acidobacteriaceae bacterium]|nr:tetratricopeptide repeat protein [Acidobacteriaceae bacterium]